MHNDFWFMVFCFFVACVMAVIFFVMAHAQPQELGWLAKRQIQARIDCAQILKARLAQ